MNEFDFKAAGWDLNPMHIERSEAVTKQILERIPVDTTMTAVEFGAGTALTSFMLKDYFREITMLDSSAEMVRVMTEKVKMSGAGNLKPYFFDLEKERWTGIKFNFLISQMVLHHVADIDDILRKFHDMLLPDACLAIADLCPEDGSFHGEGFSGHKGFDTEKLADRLILAGFDNISCKKCFTIRKKISESEQKDFDVFLITARLLK